MTSELRIPPQSANSEQAVLGGLMIDPSAWPKVADLLGEEDFYRADNRLIFRAIRALAERSRPFDVVTVCDFLRAKGHADDVDGGTYVISLASGTASAANIAAYAAAVADAARLRRGIEVGHALVDACFEPEGRDAEEVLADAARALTELQPAAYSGARSMRETLGEWLAQYEARLLSGSKLTGLPTPWNGLNAVTHGLQPGTVYIVAARPSMGKSALALNLALFSGMRKVNTVLFSLEMSAEDCQARNIASLAKVPFSWISAPTAEEDDDHSSFVAAAVRDMRDATLRIDDTPSITHRQFEARALRMHQQEPIELLIVDHMHDFRIDPKNARFEYGEIVQAGKRLAKQLRIPVVILAQLNRQLSGRADKRPTLTDLRESGEIEQKADVIAFLHREDYYDTPDHRTHLQGVVELHIAKGRNIHAGERIYLRNCLAQMRLEDWEGPLPPPVAELDGPRKSWGHGFKRA